MASGAARLLSGLLALAMLALAYTAFRYSASEFYSYQGKRYEKHWEKRSAIASTEQWERARWWMQKALALNDKNPDTNLRTARILEWYSFTPEPDGEAIRANLAEAVESIDRAIALRPQQGFGYSSRALLQARRWEIDASLSDDLRRARALAPWERVVQLQLMHAGLRAWPALDQAGRSEVLTQLEASARERPDMATAMLTIAGTYAQLKPLCDRLSELHLNTAKGLGSRECRTEE
jgi:hypothetical protein